MAKALLVLTLVTACLTGGALASPKHLWPLTSKTFLWDQQDDDNHGFLLYPDPCPYLVADSPFRDGSFFYDSQGSSVADFRITETGTFDSFSFTMWIKPDASQLTGTSVIFEYQTISSVISGNQVRFVRATLEEGRVKVAIGKSSSNLYGSIHHGTSLSSATFTSLIVSYSKDDTNMYVTLGSDRESANVGREIPIKVSGNWRVGGNWGRWIQGFKGKISCIGFFDFSVHYSDHKDEFYCDETYNAKGALSCTISPEPGSIETTTTTTQPTTTTEKETTQPPPPTPYRLWPLDSFTRGYDVMTRVAPLTSAKKLACLRIADFSGPMLASKGRPLLFDGSWRSVLVLPLEQSALGGSFSVFTFLKLVHLKAGRLWSYATSSGVRVDVFLESDVSVTVKVWEAGSGSPCGLVSSSAVNTNNFLSLTVQKTASHVKVKLSGTEWLQPHTCSTSAGGSEVGSLTIADRDGGAAFHGSLACLAVFSEDLQSIDENNVLNLCSSYDSDLYSLGVCDATPDIQVGKYSLLDRNLEPTAIAQPMTSLPSSSLTQCASACQQKEPCRSFSVSTLTVTSTCRLYDFVSVDRLTASSGRNYYEIKTWTA